MLTTKKWGALSTSANEGCAGHRRSRWLAAATAHPAEPTRPTPPRPGPSPRGPLALLFALALVLVACDPPGRQALLRGERLLRQGQPEAAIVPLLEAARLLQTNDTACAQALNFLGLAYHGSGRPAEAAQAYQGALNKDLNLFIARYNRGCLFLEHTNLAAAITDLTIYTTHRPEDPRGWLLLGTAQLRARLYENAERHLQRGLSTDPPPALAAELHNALGLVQAHRRRPAEAFKQLNAALQYRTNYAAALLNQAIIAQVQLADRSLAVERYRDYLEAIRPGRNAGVEDLLERLEADLQPRPTLTSVVVTNPVVPNALLVRVPPATNPAPLALPSTSTPTPTPTAQPAPPAPATSAPPARTAALPAIPPSLTPTQVVRAPTPSPSPPIARPSAEPRSNQVAQVPTPTPSVPAPPKPSPPTNVTETPKPEPVRRTEPPPPVVVVKLEDEPAIKPASELPRPSTASPPSTRPPTTPQASTPPPAASPGAAPSLAVATATLPTTPATATPTTPAATPVAPPPEEESPPPRKRGFFQRINPLNLLGSRDQKESKEDPRAGVTPLERSRPATSNAAVPAATPTRVATTPARTPAAAAPPPPLAPAPAPPAYPRYTYLSPPAPAPGDRARAEPSFTAGFQAQQSGNLPQAMASYRDAVNADPAYFEALFNLGVAAFDANRWSEALNAYERALAVRPADTAARLNLALTLERANYPADAVRELERVLQAHPEHVDAHLSAANLYAQKLEDRTRARTHYQRVLELDPRHPQSAVIRRWLAVNR